MRLTERQALVLAYVVEHPGASTGTITREMGFAANGELSALSGKRLVGRQGGLWGRDPFTWWPERQALHV